MRKAAVIDIQNPENGQKALKDASTKTVKIVLEKKLRQTRKIWMHQKTTMIGYSIKQMYLMKDGLCLTMKDI